MNNESKKSIRQKNNSMKKMNRKTMFAKVAALLLLAIFIFGNLPNLKVAAAGNYSGTVFLDFNGNSVFDSTATQLETGVGGVTVTLYDNNGAAQGTANTGTNGAYTIASTGAGPYRVEFTNIPTYLKPGAFGSAAGTTVQYVANAGVANINLALIDSGKFDNETNAETATTIFLNGQYNATALNGLTTLMRTPYNATGHDFTGSTPTAGFEGVELAESQETGSIYGMAWQSSRNRVYVGAYQKRYSGFGANGPDAIYVFDKAGTTIGTIDLDTVIGTANSAGADAHDFVPAGGIVYDIGTGNASYDGVGKRSLGDIDISADQKTLFVVNLFDRRIYAINVASGTPSGATLIKSWAAPDATGAARHRPFALDWHNGRLWVGSVDQDGTDAYVHSMTPNLSSPTGSEPFTLETTVSLGFTRQSYQGTAANNAARISTWRAWATDPAATTYLSNAGSEIAFPQPMLSDIEFDETGSMILGFRDRFGDQTGSNQRFRPSDTGNTWGVSAGDILRVCSVSGAFVVEGSAGCATSGGLTNSGPGGGASPEHYNWDLYQDGTANWDTTLNAGGAFHWETTQGSLLQLAGRPSILTTAMDPNNDYSGGYLRLTNSTGRREGITTDGATTQATVLANGGYSLYDAGTFSGTPPTQTTYFGKSNGLGDVEALTNPAPIEIGNRIWRDANNNGRQDPNEAVLANVLVGLYNSSGTLISTVETNAAGQYLFSSSTTATDVNADGDATPEYDYGLAILPETNYTVAILNSNFNAGGALVNTSATTANSATSGSVTTNDAVTDVRDSDGVILGTAVGTGASLANLGVAFTTGTTGSNNHSFDFGFGDPVSIGSTVFNDVNNNGVFDGGETGIGGVSVELLYDANNDGAINGTELTNPIATATTSTVAGSVGNYFFGGLTPGNYQVRIPTAPTTFTVSSLPTNATDSRIDNDDNGTQAISGGSTISPIINLTLGAEPVNGAGANNEAGQGSTQDDATTDANGDMTVDFGFFAPSSLGDRAFSDLDRDGVQDAGEPGIANVRVRLYDSVGTEINVGPDGIFGTADDAAGGVLTNGTGNYLFQGLPPGTYSVGFTAPTGFGYAFTLQDAAAAPDATDSDANPATGRTGNYTLTAGQSNLTVDAGFVQTVSLGNQVYNDVNNNGIRDAAEVGIVGVTVNLYLDANNDGTPDGGVIATTTTVANGLYLFSGLAPNTYIVGVVTPTNFVSSSVNGGDPDTNAADNDDNGVLTVGTETRSNPVTLTLTGEPIGETPYNEAETPDNSNNLTVDFGFTSSYALGNRVWFDTDNNGAIDAFESGINGVTLTLLNSDNSVYDSDPNTTGVQALTVTTANGGYYRFNNLPTGIYKVRINAANFDTGGLLAGYANTTGNNTGDVDSTAALAGENGVDPTTYVGTNAASPRQFGVLSNAITLGTGASEPTAETDLGTGDAALPDGFTDLTVDFGFYRLGLSGTVWNDNGAGGGGSNNGTLAGTEAGIANVRVQIYSGTTEILVGLDGILGTADDGAGGMFTNASGNYNFQNLAPGTYRVVVSATPANSSTGAGNNTNPDTNIDSDDNGFPDNTGSFAGKTISGTITLTPRGETSSTGTNLWTDSTGTTNNPTVDFGFVGFSPTLVQLDKFDVLTDGNSVELKWSTGNEVGNLGFNVYREVDGKRQLLNSAPIAGNALRSSVQLQASGSDYIWTDKDFVQNAVYYLEDLDVDGSVNLHGAVTPEFRQTLGNQPNARMFSELATVESLNGTTEVVANQATATPNVKDSTAALRQSQIAALGGAKITVNHDGWYRVSVQQLAAAGFNTNSNSQFWQLYADGAEVPFKLNSDSIEFFGRGLDTQLTDKQAYYLINGQNGGLRVNAFEGGAAEGNVAESFPVTVKRQDRAIYVSALVNGEDNENWFGAIVSRSTPTVQNLNAVNVNGNERAHLSLKLQGVVVVDHSVNVRFNDTELGSVEFNGLENKQVEFDLPRGTVIEGENHIYLQANGVNNDMSVVDSIRLSYQRGYTANNNRIRFSVPANQSVRVNGFTEENISVYELRSGAARMQVVGASENTDGNYGFSLGAANADREMIAVVNSSVEQATVEANTPSTLSNAGNKADFVIVTANELRDSADNLAAMREAQGLRTKVVLVDDVFDEFSFGRRDPEAIKQFLKTAATKWQTKPNYALLFGDSSYDTRNNLGLSVTRDFVPTKLVDTVTMETASDSWLADFDNDGVEDIALGRLPVGDASEAAAAVEKLARFDNQKARQERTDVLVADSGFEGYSAELQTLLPSDATSFRIDRSAGTDAETHQNIIAQLNNNPLLVTYTGHGSPNIWASSGVFSSNDVAGLNNSELSFYLLMNCLNGYTHQPTGDSLAETLFKSPNSAVAIWTSSGVTNPENQAAASRMFTNIVFNKGAVKAIRIGDVVREARRATTDSDVRRTWQLVGDPTVFVK